MCRVNNNRNILLSSRVTKITEHKFRPILSVEELLAAHPTSDAIWDHNSPCGVSIATVYNIEITTNNHIIKKSTSTCCKSYSQELLSVIISMAYDDDESWFDAHKDFDLWHNTSETIDNYDKLNEPPNTSSVVGTNNESSNKHIKPNFYIGKYET